MIASVLLWLFTAQAGAAPPLSKTAEALRAEAFEAAQNAMLSEAGDALAKVAARFARGGDALAELESARERSSHALAAVDDRLLGLMGDSGGNSEAARAAALIERDRLRAAVAEADRHIELLNPAYAELTRPRALTLAEAQTLLRGDEALLLLLPTAQGSFVFAITREGAAWNRADMSETDIADSVGVLRNSIVNDLADGTQTFDRGRSFALYDALIRPVEPLFAHKHALMIVANGALGTLPMQTLVTEKPADGRTDDAVMRDTHWLIDRYAFSTLPAVSSLRALRCLLAPSSQRMAGCGPEVGGSNPNDPASVRSMKPTVEMVGFGAPALASLGKGARGGVKVPRAASVFRGALADSATLRSLPSLPGAAAELAMVGQIFGLGGSEIETGENATETRVKQSRALQDAHFVLFSTHGLLAMESRDFGASEPGLVLTPPHGASTDLDDGLLTSSEAAGLKLSARLVVLSACNTAASDGTPGANGLSGLARAFFFAGAHALVVSHWNVSDDATSMLMSQLFTAARAPTEEADADMLRSAILKVRSSPDFASPIFWAPFVLVGTPR